MRSKSKKPKKQRKYQYDIKHNKHEAHKLVSAPLSRKLREDKGFRSLPVREGDNVDVHRGKYKGRSGKVSRVDPQKIRIYIDGIVNKKTDNTEIAVPIHPSNVVITKYNERDRKRLELINRRIKDEERKIDIESVLAKVAEEEAEEEDFIEFDEEEFEDADFEGDLDGLVDEEDIDLIDDDEFELIDEDDEELLLDDEEEEEQ